MTTLEGEEVAAHPGDREFYVTGAFAFVFRDGKLHHVEQDWDNGGQPWLGVERRHGGYLGGPDEEIELADDTDEIRAVNDWINEFVGLRAALPPHRYSIIAWEDDPRFPQEEWRMEVFNGDTQLGYRDWRQHRIDQLEAHEVPFMADPYTARQCPDCELWVYTADGPFAENDPTKSMADMLHYEQEHGDDVERGTVRGFEVCGFPFFNFNEEPVMIDPRRQPSRD